MTLKFLLKQDHMGLEISKGCSSYSVYLISAKLYEDIDYHCGIQGITFLDNWPCFKNLLLHFEILTRESLEKS